jgi:hypothetical protein
MEVSGQLRLSAALPTGYEAGWAPDPVWTLWRRGNRTRGVAIPIQLSLLRIHSEFFRKQIAQENDGFMVLTAVAMRSSYFAICLVVR